jgi:hypothetical protein
MRSNKQYHIRAPWSNSLLIASMPNFQVVDFLHLMEEVIPSENLQIWVGNCRLEPSDHLPHPPTILELRIRGLRGAGRRNTPNKENATPNTGVQASSSSSLSSLSYSFLCSLLFS